MRDIFGIPLAAFHGIDHWYSGTRGWLQHTADTLMAWIVVLKTGQPFRRLWFKRAYTPDHPLRDGDTLPFFPDWRVLHLPGHTHHDIALYNEETGDLYAGDLILKVQTRYIPPFPVTMPLKMAESLTRLASLKVNRVFLAHGGAVTGKITPEFFLSAIPYIGARLKPMMRFIWLFTRFSKGIDREKK
jgi:glyoxylase-like metal-dependent hydrolase (beta-lactamase superfamily II)